MQRQTTLGRCPSCAELVPERALLIRYRRDDAPASFAECPECRSVVRPV